MLYVPDTLRTKKIGEQYFIYDSLYGNMLKVSPDVIDIINTIKSGNTINKIEKEQGMNGLYGKLSPLIRRGLLLESGRDVPDNQATLPFKDNPFLQTDPVPRLFRFYTGYLCNQQCDYCHISGTCGTGKNSGNPHPKKMSWEIARGALDQIAGLPYSPGKKEIAIQFYGGEPLLNFPVMEKILAYSKEVFPGDLRPRFILNTNGTIFNSRIADSLSRYNIDLHVSLDGITETTNRYRKLRSGKPALDLVLKNIDNLIQHGFRFQLNTSLTDANIDGLVPLIDFAAQKNIQSVYLSIPAGHTPTISGEIMAQKVGDAYQYSLKTGVFFYGHWQFILEKLFKNNDFIKDASGVLSRIFIEPGGDFYLMPFPHEKIGRYDKISHFTDLPVYGRIKAKWQDAMAACSGCDMAAGCGMRCKCNVMYHTGTEEGYADECRFVKRIIERILSGSNIWKKTTLSSRNLKKGKNCKWIMHAGELSKCIDAYWDRNDGEPLLIILCVPDSLPSSPRHYSPLQSLFITGLDLMRDQRIQILSTGSRIQLKTQCRDGFKALEQTGILNSEQYAEIASLWYLKRNNPVLGIQTRSPERVAEGVIDRVKVHGGITFLLRPGSLRIGDFVADIITASDTLKDILIADCESPVDCIKREALHYWNCRSNLNAIYLNGNRFLEMEDADMAKITADECIVLYCLAESYNMKRYESLVGEVVNKCSCHFGESREVWIAWPGFKGKPVSLKNLIAEKPDKKEHYTLIIRPG